MHATTLIFLDDDADRSTPFADELAELRALDLVVVVRPGTGWMPSQSEVFIDLVGSEANILRALDRYFDFDADDRPEVRCILQGSHVLP